MFVMKVSLDLILGSESTQYVMMFNVDRRYEEYVDCVLDGSGSIWTKQHNTMQEDKKIHNNAIYRTNTTQQKYNQYCLVGFLLQNFLFLIFFDIRRVITESLCVQMMRDVVEMWICC